MAPKRLTRFLFPLLIVLAIFWKPVFEFGAGWVIRALLAHHQWHLSFDELKWEKGGFLFVGAKVIAPEIFTLDAKRVFLSLKNKMIDIEGSHLSMLQWKFDDDWPDWKISMKEGILEEARIGVVNFSLERLNPNQIARAVFEREGAQLTLEATREKQAVRLSLLWNSLHLTELNDWIDGGMFQEGTSDGYLDILFVSGKKEMKAHGTFKEASLAFGPWKGEGISLECDWEGPLALSPDVMARAVLSHAYCQMGDTAFEITGGSMSSFPGVGAKIELHSNFPWSAEVKVGFGKEAWVEGEISFDRSRASLSEQFWECTHLEAPEVAFLQSILSPFFPEAREWSLQKGTLSGRGTWGEEWSIDSVDAQKVSLVQGSLSVGWESLKGDEKGFSFSGAHFATPFLNGNDWRGDGFQGKGSFSGQLGGSEVKIVLFEPGVAEVEISGGRGRVRFDWEKECLIAHLEEGEFTPLKLKHLSMEISAGKEEVHCYDLRGDAAELPFHVPHFALRGSLWAFDARWVGPSWDLLRVWGTAEKGFVAFDLEKSHFLGAPLQIESFVFGKEGIESLHLDLKLPLQSLEMGADYLRKKGVFPKHWDLSGGEGETEVSIHYESKKDSTLSLSGVNVVWEGTPLPLSLAVRKEGERWFANWKIGESEGRAHFAWDLSSIQLFEGVYQGPYFETALQGRIEPALSGPMPIQDLRVKIRSKDGRVGALFEGSGNVEWEKIDLHLTASDLTIGRETVENRGSVHIDYTAEKGLVFKGIDLQSGKGHCKIGLLTYDLARKRWLSTHSEIRLPPEFFSFFGAEFPFPIEQNLEMVADLEWAPHFLLCKVKEGLLPIGGEVRHVKDLEFAMDGSDGKAQCQWLHQERSFAVDLNIKWESRPMGTLILREESLARSLMIEWGLKEDGELSLYRIEGGIEGMEASFYSDPTGGLIGTVDFDFLKLQGIFPKGIFQKITDFQLGAGYEFKGKFFLEKGSPSFQGILSGKEIEILGYRFRTLFAQVELGKDRIQVSNLKLSDSAGVLQIKSLLALPVEGSLWSIDLPELLIQELRPSLLQKIGESSNPMTPLIVRELKIEDFKGLLGYPSTFTSHGKLTFINSYRRNHTMFDLPADVLGLLVGLDQELLIPAYGTLFFEMGEGVVHFTELTDSFSQGKRSQFFLIQSEDSPYLDFAGNLRILVKMKQFVLFKFTEFFLISIEGTLADPLFRLQKKKGFLGL